jgi:hypothetical protein
VLPPFLDALLPVMSFGHHGQLRSFARSPCTRGIRQGTSRKTPRTGISYLCVPT